MESETEPEKRGEFAPVRLPEKLKRIRTDYGLTQGKMLLIINPTESDEGNRARVSQYENGLRVPSLVETYNYARFSSVTMETLVNDNLDLPTTIRQNSDELEMQEYERTNEVNNEADNKAENNEITSLSLESNEIKQNSKSENFALGESGIYCEELIDLPLVIGSQLVEAVTLNLPSQTLDKLDDMRLELVRQMPRNLRPFLTLEGIVNFCIMVVLMNYETHRENSLIAEQTQKIIDGLKEENLSSIKAEI